MALLARRLALARVSHRDAAARRPRPRQRLPAAVRRVARRFRDAADPCRQPVSGAADAGVPADHRPVRPARRRRAVVRAAAARARRLPAAALLGEPALLRDDHGQGRGADAVRQRLARRAQRAAGRVRRRRRRDRLLLRAAALRVAGDGARRQPRVHAAALPRDLHRRREGHPRHADHRRLRDAARRALRRPARLPRRRRRRSPAAARWSSCR